MLMLLVAALTSAHPPSAAALQDCKPVLARKAGGDV